MPSMMQIAKLLAKRPTDTTIRIYRIVLGLLIGLVMALDFGGFRVRFGGGIELYLRYALFLFALLPIVFGALGMCFARRKHVRWAEAIFGLLLIIIGQGFLVTDIAVVAPALPQATQSGSVDYTAAVSAPTSTAPTTPVHIGAWLTLIALLPLLSGVTGKMVTSPCMKYKEKITKIRI